MVKFRFQDLEIWQLAIEVADKLFNIADMLEKRKLYHLPNSYTVQGCQLQIIPALLNNSQILPEYFDNHPGYGN